MKSKQNLTTDNEMDLKLAVERTLPKIWEDNNFELFRDNAKDMFGSNCFHDYLIVLKISMTHFQQT